jgi:hypothetical protein
MGNLQGTKFSHFPKLFLHLGNDSSKNQRRRQPFGALPVQRPLVFYCRESRLLFCIWPSYGYCVTAKLFSLLNENGKSFALFQKKSITFISLLIYKKAGSDTSWSMLRQREIADIMIGGMI